MSVLPPSTELLTEEFLQEHVHRELAVHYGGNWYVYEVNGFRYSTTPQVRWLNRDYCDGYGEERSHHIEADKFHKIKCWYLLPTMK